MMHTTRMGAIRRRTRGIIGLLAVAGALLAGGPSAQAANGPGSLEPGQYRMAYQSATASSIGRYLLVNLHNTVQAVLSRLLRALAATPPT